MCVFEKVRRVSERYFILIEDPEEASCALGTARGCFLCSQQLPDKHHRTSGEAALRRRIQSNPEGVQQKRTLTKSAQHLPNEPKEDIKYVTRRVRGVVLNPSPSRTSSPERVNPPSLTNHKISEKEDLKIINQLSDDLEWISCFIEKYAPESNLSISENNSTLLLSNFGNSNEDTKLITHNCIHKQTLHEPFSNISLKSAKSQQEKTPSISSYVEERAMFSQATYIKESNEFLNSPPIVEKTVKVISADLSLSTNSSQIEKNITENDVVEKKQNSNLESEEIDNLPGPHSIPTVSRRNDFVNLDDRPLLPPPQENLPNEKSPSGKRKSSSPRSALQGGATQPTKPLTKSPPLSTEITAVDQTHVKTSIRAKVTSKKPLKLANPIKTQMDKKSLGPVPKLTKNNRSGEKKLKTVDHGKKTEDKKEERKSVNLKSNIKKQPETTKEDVKVKITNQATPAKVSPKSKIDQSTKKKYYKYKGHEKKSEVICSYQGQLRVPPRHDIQEIVRKQREERKQKQREKEATTKAQDERRQRQLVDLQKRSKHALLRSKKRPLPNENEKSSPIDEDKEYNSLEFEPLKIPKLNLFQDDSEFKIPPLNLESESHINSENITPGTILNTQGLVKDIISLTKSVYSDLKSHTSKKSPSKLQNTTNQEELVKSPRKFNFHDLEQEIKQYVNSENNKSFSNLTYKQSQKVREDPKAYTSNNLTEQFPFTPHTNSQENLAPLDSLFTKENIDLHNKLKSPRKQEVKSIQISNIPDSENTNVQTKLKSPRKKEEKPIQISNKLDSSSSSSLDLDKNRYIRKTRNKHSFSDKLSSSKDTSINRVHQGCSPISFDKRDIGVGVSSQEDDKQDENKGNNDSESNESAYNFITAVKLKLLNQTSGNPNPPPTRFIDLSSSMSLGSVFVHKPEEKVQIPSSITRAVQTYNTRSLNNTPSETTLKFSSSSKNSSSEQSDTDEMDFKRNDIVPSPRTAASDLQRQFQTSLDFLDTVQQSRLQLQEAETIHALLSVTKNQQEVDKENKCINKDEPSKNIETSIISEQEKLNVPIQPHSEINSKRNFIQLREKEDFKRLSNANDSFLLTIRKERLEFDEMLRNTKDTLLNRSFGFENRSQFPKLSFGTAAPINNLFDSSLRKDYLDERNSNKQDEKITKNNSFTKQLENISSSDSKILTELTNNSGSSKQSKDEEEIATSSKIETAITNTSHQESVQEISEHISTYSKISIGSEYLHSNQNTKSHSVTKSEISEQITGHNEKTIQVINNMITEEKIRSQRLLDILNLRMKHLKEKAKAELTWLDIQKREYRQLEKLEELSKIKLSEKQIIKKMIEEKLGIKKQQHQQKKQSEDRVQELKRQLNQLLKVRGQEKTKSSSPRITNSMQSDLSEVVDSTTKFSKRSDSRKRVSINSPSSSSERPPIKCSKGTSPIDWLVINEPNSPKKRYIKNIEDSKKMKLNEKLVRDSSTSPMEINSSTSPNNSTNQNLEMNPTISSESKFSQSLIQEEIEVSKQIDTPVDNYYSEGFDSEPTTSIPSSIKVQSHNGNIIIEAKESFSSNKPPLNKMQTERRKSTSFLIKPSVTPLAASARQRRYSSGSDESIIISQTETASEHSDIEGRIGALREQLRQYKQQADRLKKEQKRLNRERLMSKEQSLIKQLNVYSNFIEKATQELEQQKSFIEKRDTSSLSINSSVVKPKIRQQIRLAEKVRRTSKNISEPFATIEAPSSISFFDDHLEDKISPSRDSPKYSDTFTYSENEIRKSNLKNESESYKSQISEDANIKIDSEDNFSEKSRSETIEEEIKTINSKQDYNINLKNDDILEKEIENDSIQNELINSSSTNQEINSENSKSNSSQKSLIINQINQEMFSECPKENSKKDKESEFNKITNNVNVDLVEEISQMENINKTISDEMQSESFNKIDKSENSKENEIIKESNIIFATKEDKHLQEHDDQNNSKNENFNLINNKKTDDKDTLEDTTSIEEEIYNLTSLDSEKSFNLETRNKDSVKHPLEIINNLLDKAEEVLNQVEFQSNEIINSKSDKSVSSANRNLSILKSNENQLLDMNDDHSSLIEENNDIINNKLTLRNDDVNKINIKEEEKKEEIVHDGKMKILKEYNESEEEESLKSKEEINVEIELEKKEESSLELKEKFNEQIYLEEIEKLSLKLEEKSKKEIDQEEENSNLKLKEKSMEKIVQEEESSKLQEKSQEEIVQEEEEDSSLKLKEKSQEEIVQEEEEDSSLKLKEKSQEEIVQEEEEDSSSKLQEKSHEEIVQEEEEDSSSKLQEKSQEEIDLEDEEDSSLISDIISVNVTTKPEVSKLREERIDALTDSILNTLIEDSLKCTVRSPRNYISTKNVSKSDTTDVRRRVSEILSERSLNASPQIRPQDLMVTTYDLPVEDNNTLILTQTNKKSRSTTNKEEQNLTSTKVDLGLALAVSGDNDTFAQEWFDDDYGLGRNPEAEELRLQQLKIEHEIQKLQEEQEQSGYYFIRAIPNKPPPPYTPPSQPKTVAVPNTQDHVCRIVRQIGIHLYQIWIQSGESGLEEAQPPSSFLISDSASSLSLEEKSERHYKLFLYELTVKLLKDSFGLISCGMLSPPVIDPIWSKAVAGKVRRRKTPPKTEEVFLSMIERQVNVLLGFEPDSYRERLMAKWPRKKGESVDELLMVESYEEESDWVNYDDDELAIKNQITTSLLNQLISETILVFKEILIRKK